MILNFNRCDILMRLIIIYSHLLCVFYSRLYSKRWMIFIFEYVLCVTTREKTCHANNFPCRWLQRHRRKNTTTELGLSGRVARRVEVLTFSGFCFVRLMALTRRMINWVLPMGQEVCSVHPCITLSLSLSVFFILYLRSPKDNSATVMVLAHPSDCVVSLSSHRIHHFDLFTFTAPRIYFSRLLVLLYFAVAYTYMYSVPEKLSLLFIQYLRGETL